MKAFLLAAGKGERLRPLTNHKPKCLLPIGSKPLLEIWYRLLEQYGIREVLINTHHLADQVSRFLSTFKTTIHTHVTFEEELLGSAGTLAKNKAFVQGEPFFWIIYADSLTNVNLRSLFDFHQSSRAILTMALFHTNVPEQSGIVTLDQKGKIVSFIEKPKNPAGDLSNTGIMVASSKLLDEIPEQYPCDLSLDVLPRLVGRMYGKTIHEFFIDIGTPENYRLAQEKWGELKFSFP